MSYKKRTSGERIPEIAQSEVLGIILLLGLTMVAIGGILYFAEPAISGGMELSESSQIENEFSLLDSKLATSALGASEAQNVEMNLHGGELRADPEGATLRMYHNFTDEEVKLTANSLGREQLTEGIDNLDGPDSSNCVDPLCDPVNQSGDVQVAQDNFNRTLVEVDIGKIEYTDTDNEEKIAYEGGAVWKKSFFSNDSVMISPPEFHYSTRGQTLTVPLFNVTTNFTASSTAGRNIRVGTTPEAVQLFDENPIVGGTVTAEIQSEYYRAWAKYFESRTAGTVGEDNIDDDEQTAIVELAVPHDDDIDGGHSFQGSADGDWFDGDPGENEYFLSASGYIEDTLSDARNDNDNDEVDDCTVDEGGIPDDCEIAPDSGEDYLLYFSDDPDFGDADFDLSEGNVTIAVDGAYSHGTDTWSITDNDTGNTRLEVMLRDEPQQTFMPGQLDLNPPPNSGNTSEMIVFVHSSVDSIDIAGAGGSEKYVTLYAPNTVISPSGFGNAEWEGAIVGQSLDASNNEPQNPMRQGSPVDLNLGAQTDTITYLQVTENEVRVE